MDKFLKWIVEWFTVTNRDSVLASLIAACLYALFGAGILQVINTYRQDKSKYTGHWRITIHWNEQWAKYLFGRSESLIPVNDPHSIGDAYLSYGLGSKKGQYRGLSYFSLMSGTTKFSELCVEIYDVDLGKLCFTRNFPFIGVFYLQSISFRSLIRKPTVKFDYPEFSNYFIRFKKSTDPDKLTGNMICIMPEDKEEIVGRVRANRIA